MFASELTDMVKEALYDRFIIEREIGRGGMATVFLAEERHPRRRVAVKVLEPQLATGVARERFLREVEFSSKLTHPNIVPIFMAGEADGLLFHVMPYIDGHSLRVRLAREGKLPLDEAIQIASETADALHYAHGRGVVHRDIKPENILLSDGHAIVADFGIARALCVACGDEGNSNITIAGVPIGTPGYMSPEQGSGEEVDARTDVYSLGAVVYEMLTGRPPFTGPTIEAIIAAKYTQPTPTLRDAGWTLSDAIDQAVQRAMTLERDGRFATTKDFLAAIKPRISAELLRETLPPPTDPGTGATPRRRSIAVLPFKNLSTDPDNDYFSDGITEDIITRLSKIAGLSVTSRTSVLRYRDTDRSLREIGRELKVTSILEGSVRRAGNRVRVAAQLIDAGADHHLWAERYDRELTDIFEIQDEIAQSIADALRTRLSADEKAEIARKPTDNVEAYNVYMQGRFFWAKFTPDGINRAIELFTQATRADPSFALAHAGLADCHLIMALNLGLAPAATAMPQAKAAATTALALDPDLADAHSILGAVYDWYEWNWAAAERAHRQASALHPDGEKQLVLYAFHLASMGRYEEAVAAVRQAEQNCPVSVLAAANVALQLYHARRHEEALAQMERALALDANAPPAYLALTWIHLALGRTADAVDAARRAADLTGHPPPRRASLGCALAADGHTAEAERILTDLTTERGTSTISPLDLGLLAAYLGRADEAFRWLDAAVEERAPWLNHLASDPAWDVLRSDPRFGALTERIGLP